MQMLSREAILAVQDRQTEIVEVPEWGGAVRVRGVSDREWVEFEASLSDRKGHVSLDNYRARLLVKAIVGDDMRPIFSKGDIAALGEKSAAALSRVFAAAKRLSGFSQEDLEEHAKNSESNLG